MNALAHTTDLAMLLEDHEKNLRYLRDTVVNDIFAEARRLHKTGRTVTVALHPEFIAVYVHEANNSISDFTATHDDAESLISMLKQMEQIGAPKITEEIYDLEETPDAETV